MNLKDVFSDFITFYDNAGWMAEVFTVVLAVVVFNFILIRVLRVLFRKAEGTDTVWDEAILNAIGPPLRLIVWVVGGGIALEMLGGGEEPNQLIAYIPQVRQVLVIVLIVWFLIRIVRGVEEGLTGSRDDIDHTTIDAIGKLVRISLVITGALVILQTLGISVSGVLAFGGVGGIAVGFAAKDLLANFFGGLYVYLDRPFSKGDWIRSPDRDLEGVVEHIGWRVTRIRTFDKRPQYIPNSLFTSIIVQNPSRMTNRRIRETIGVRYDDVGRVDRVVKEVKRMLETHPEIDQDQIVMVNFNQFGPSSLDFFIYCHTRTTDWAEYHAVKHEVLMQIYRIIEGHGAEIAFPTRTIKLSQQHAESSDPRTNQSNPDQAQSEPAKNAKHD